MIPCNPIHIHAVKKKLKKKKKKTDKGVNFTAKEFILHNLPRNSFIIM